MGKKNLKPLSYKDYIEGTRQILEASKTEKKPYTVFVLGKEYIVHPNVFSPKYFKDAELFAGNFPIKKGEEILEIGPGTGVISITAINKGAKKAITIDMNPSAVKNTQENIEKHNLEDKMEVRQGDVYDALRPNEKFDTIFWNTPFGLIEENHISDLEKSVYDPGYKSTEKFIKGAKDHLKENGRLLIGFSSTLGKLDLIKRFSKEAELNLKLIYEVESEEVHPVKFEIFEAKLKKMKDIYILGINSVYHESAAAILKNGELLAFAEEERFNRIKHAKHSKVDNPDELPRGAINYCLKVAKIKLKNIDYFAYSFEPGERLKQNINLVDERELIKNSWGTEKGENIFYNKILNVPKIISKKVGQNITSRFIFVPHHISHAASSYYPSLFKDAAVLVVDGIAEFASTWIGKASGQKLEKIDEIYYPNSLGFLWEKFSEYLGFLEYDAAKTMGLSAYGESYKFRKQFHKIIQIDKRGHFEVDNKYMQFRTNKFNALEKLFKEKKRNPKKHIFAIHENIAATLQEKTEEVLIKLVKNLHRKTKSENLCLSGGVALNCVANAKIFQKGGFKNIYIQPAAHDAGTALGAAYYIWHNNLKKKRCKPIKHAYWGPEFSDKEIEQVLKNNKLKYQKVKNIESVVARFISKGNIVAWFHGRMEVGPRALGNRSILADPRSPVIRDELNRKVKFREIFRPLCPSVMSEKAREWFDIGNKVASPLEYMLMVVKVKRSKIKIIPAVVHVDNTSRIQIVKKEINPRYYKLLKEFEKITKIPIVLNTSFNIQEPIVCTPQDAINTFTRSKIDYLAINDYLIEN